MANPQTTTIPTTGALTRTDDGQGLGWVYAPYVATTAGTSVKSSRGILHSITFNKPVATGVVTLYDGTSTAGTVIGTITVPASPQPVTLTYDITFSTGLFIVIATAAQYITISYI